MDKQYFHFTIGPVQDFVAQARRTRDFWAGSFLLSWLAGVAMTEVRHQGGTVEFPLPDEKYLQWLTGDNDQGQPPQQGAIPNRFKAYQAEVPRDFDPKRVEKVIRDAWRLLAEKVWEADLEEVVLVGEQTRAIWDRQVNGFWELTWCLSDSQQASDLLDRRKNWRTHRPPSEPGVKCSLMEGWQELSGAARPGGPVHSFWQQVRECGDSLARDLRPDEPLCAIAFIKRRFVHVFDQFEYALPSIEGNQEHPVLYGWWLPASVPSVAYLAAAPWLAYTIEAAGGDDHTRALIRNLESSIGALETAREGHSLAMIDAAVDRSGFGDWCWRRVNGQWLFEPTVQQALKEAESDPLLAGDSGHYREILNNLKALRRHLQAPEPSPFYAVVLMDGDSLGGQMSQVAKQAPISRALGAFTREAPAIVSKHSGFLVYAGGDDVLALLPQTKAISCAQALRECYEGCFSEQNRNLNTGEESVTSTLSGGIEFAHYKSPLTQVLQDAHRLLDDIAKDETGRDSLAIRVWKGNGLHAQWSVPWRLDSGETPVTEVVALSRTIGPLLSGEMARSFFFKLDELIVQLGLGQDDHPFDEASIESLTRSAWSHSGNSVEQLPEELPVQLLNACSIHRRYSGTAKSATFYTHTSQQLNRDALKLLQFLASENQAFEPIPARQEA